MNDLIRPAMYEAHHDIEPVIEPQAGAELHMMSLVPFANLGIHLPRAAKWHR